MRCQSLAHLRPALRHKPLPPPVRPLHRCCQARQLSGAVGVGQLVGGLGLDQGGGGGVVDASNLENRDMFMNVQMKTI